MKQSFIITQTLLLLGIALGYYVGGQAIAQEKLDAIKPVATTPKFVSMTSGMIDNKAGGVFLLDHAKSSLQFWMMDQESGELVGLFKANLDEDMQFRTQPPINYNMAVTYIMPSDDNGVAKKTSEATCLVTEANSGKVIAYRVVYDSKDRIRGRYQAGKLKMVFTSNFR